MARIISASIDVTKIDKSKLVAGKHGAQYYNFDIIVNDSTNDYGNDVSICEKQTKEQRTAKEKKVYIGSGKTVWSSEQTNNNTSSGTSASADDLAF